MSMESSIYIGFTDGASFHTQNLALVAWVIYTPMGQVLSSGGVCLRPSSSNVAEYSVVIELLWDAISHGILSLEETFLGAVSAVGLTRSCRSQVSCLNWHIG